jgi:hypothetical protein
VTLEKREGAITVSCTLRDAAENLTDLLLEVEWVLHCLVKVPS